MKLRKIVSLFTAAAVTASCAAGMLMLGASAEYTLSQIKVTSENGTTMTIADYLGTMSGRVTKTISQKIEFDSSGESFAVRLSKKDLIAMRSDAVCTKYEFNITDDRGFKYKAVIDQDSIPSDSSKIPENGISLALNFIAGSYTCSTDSGTATVKCVDVKGTGSYGGVSVTYYFMSSNFSSLMSAYDISTVNKINCLSSVKADDGSIRYSLEYKISGGYDAQFTLTGDLTNGKRLAYDPYSKYYHNTKTDEPLGEILSDILGYSETEADKHASTLETAVANIKSTLTNEYYSKDELTGTVKEYLNNTANLKALINDILKEDANKKAVYEAIYSVFGESISSYQADKIADFISDELTDKLYAELVKDNSYITETYNGRIKFFLNQYASDILTALKKKVADIQAQLGLDPQSITQALEKLTPYSSGNEQTAQPTRNTETSPVEQPTVTNADKSAYELAAANGFSGTITEWFNTLAGQAAYDLAVQKGYTGTPEQWFSSLAGSSGKAAYEHAVAYGYSGTFDQWLASLTTGTDAGTNTENRNSGNGASAADVQDFYEWAIERYGSIEGFMAAVANMVLKEVNDGESAYEIAVRNGFVGTEKEWLDSLAGESAYEIAVRNGFNGTEAEWLESLRGQDAEDGRVIYMYGYNHQSAPSAQNSGADTTITDTGEIIIDNTDDVPPAPYTGDVTVDTGNSAPVKTGAGDVTVDTGNGAPVKAGAGEAAPVRTANPSTGSAAAVLIPAAAAASILLIRKDKRKRGRR